MKTSSGAGSAAFGISANGAFAMAFQWIGDGAYTTDTGTTWNTSALSGNGSYDLAASADAAYVYFAQFNALAQKSTDHGATFSPLSFTSTEAIACSDTGQYVIGTSGAGGLIYASSSYGDSPTSFSTGNYIRDVASSGTGQYMYATHGGSSLSGPTVIWRSSDYGVVFSSTTVDAGGMGSNAVCSSDDGATVWMGTWEGNIWKSLDHGATWALSKSGQGNLYRAGCSSDGSKVVFAKFQGAELAYTADGGASWTNPGAFSSVRVARMSSDGSKLWALDGSGIWLALVN